MKQQMTFILHCNQTDEYYCGKACDVMKELSLLKKGSKGRFFHQCPQRRDFSLVFIAEGDYEKSIKRFGIRNFLESQKRNVALFNSMVDLVRSLP